MFPADYKLPAISHLSITKPCPRHIRPFREERAGEETRDSIRNETFLVFGVVLDIARKMSI